MVLGVCQQQRGNIGHHRTFPSSACGTFSHKWEKDFIAGNFKLSHHRVFG
jgi:hypothetical protein